MRNLYILFFCCLAALAQAQQWQPIRVGEQYNFESCQSCPRPYSCLIGIIDSASMCNHSIWVDSVHTVGSDSIFFLNKRLQLDTIIYYDGGIYRKEALFAQEQCIKRSNGEYWLASPDTFIIKSQAQIHDTWAFVPDSSIWATVDTVAWDSVIGNNMDSVKYIYLSTGDTILLSQNYGFLQFPNFEGGADYKLLGIEGNRIIGTPLLGLKDFYNFDVGDVFVYKKEWWAYGESGGEMHKLTVIEKNVYGDTLDYLIYNLFGTYQMIITSDTILPWGDWPNASIRFVKARPFELLEFWDNSYSEVNYFNTGGRFFKSMVYDTLFCPNQYCEATNSFYIDTFQGDTVWMSISYSSSEGTIDLVLEKNLGCISHFYWGFEWYGSTCLLGAYKAAMGDTIGTVPSDSFVLAHTGISKPQENKIEPFVLAPAPAQHYFQILGIEKMQEPAQLLIYNLQGVLMQQQQVSATDNTVWINNLPTGIYAVVLQNELGRWTQKLSVLRE